MSAERGVPLDRLIAEAGSGVLNIIAAPGGIAVPVRRAVIWDADGLVDVAEGDLVLAVGIRANSPEFTRLLEGAGRRGAAGVVIKGHDHEDWLRFEASRTEVAILSTSRDITWDWLHGQVRTVTSGPPAATHAQVPSDLFALADAAAANFEGPVEIDGPALQVLAFSNLGHPLDELRTNSILDRATPPGVVDWLRTSGTMKRLRETELPIRVTPPESRPRLVAPVRVGAEVLGYIWVTENDAGPSSAQPAELAEVAGVAATIMLRQQAAEDVDTQMRDGLLRAVIEGAGSVDALAAALGVSTTDQFQLIGLEATGANAADANTQVYLRNLVALRIQVATGGCTATSIGPRTYVLVRASDAGAQEINQLAHDVIGRAANQLRVRVTVAIGDELDDLTCLARSRRVVDRMLELIEKNSGPQVVTESELGPQMVLHELREFLVERPHLRQGRLSMLDELDRTQNTNYMATLRAYFDASGDRAKASKELFVHRNTLRYRLRRIQDISGLDLSDPAERLVAELQLRLVIAA